MSWSGSLYITRSTSDLPSRILYTHYRKIKNNSPSLVTKQRDPVNGQQSLFFQVDYPEIVDGIKPRHRFMSAYEQRLEPPDRQWQYL